MPYPGLLHPEPLPLHQSTAGDTQTQFCLSLCGISGSWCTQGLFESCGHLCQFDSKHEFMPPTIFLGLLLCPWMWGISSKSFQHHAATSPALTNWCEVASAYHCFPKPCYSTDTTREPWLRSWGSRKVCQSCKLPKLTAVTLKHIRKMNTLHIIHHPNQSTTYRWVRKM